MEIDYSKINQQANLDPDFLAGAKAFTDGHPLTSNPHRTGHPDWAEWDDGWHEAQYAKEYEMADNGGFLAKVREFMEFLGTHQVASDTVVIDYPTKDDVERHFKALGREPQSVDEVLDVIEDLRCMSGKTRELGVVRIDS